MPRKRLVLTEEEQALIKGLVTHTEYNDQEITAVFSHLSRSINQREIGYFRDAENGKYSGVAAVTRQRLTEFLNEYRQVEITAKLKGVLIKEPFFDRVSQARSAMKSAVANYNSPNEVWKTETFCVNAIVAWTYLAHAFFVKHGVEFNHTNADGEPIIIDGRPKLWELSRCIEDRGLGLPLPIIANLKYLIHVRNAVAHEGTSHIHRFLEPKFQSCALNFNSTMCAWFGSRFDISNDLSLAISFANIDLLNTSNIPDADSLPSIIKTANLAVENEIDSETFNDPRYSFRVHIIPRTVNNRNKADQLAYYSEPGSDIEMAIREVEREKYRPSDIVRLARGAGHRISMTTFVNFWQSIDPNKNSGLGYGIEISGQWYWYQNMADAFLEHLAK